MDQLIAQLLDDLNPFSVEWFFDWLINCLFDRLIDELIVGLVDRTWLSCWCTWSFQTSLWERIPSSSAARTPFSIVCILPACLCSSLNQSHCAVIPAARGPMTLSFTGTAPEIPRRHIDATGSALPAQISTSHHANCARQAGAFTIRCWLFDAENVAYHISSVK